MGKKKNSNASATIDPNLTLAELSAKYLEHMEHDGKSIGTCFSYAMELKTAQNELGPDTLVSEITSADVERFNACDRVMKLKSGKPKAEPSFLKTQRVLRLALNWAAQAGLIASSPIPAKAERVDAPAPEPTPAKNVRKSRVVVEIASEQPQDVVDAPAEVSAA